jgi:hypothetical protein
MRCVNSLPGRGKSLFGSAGFPAHAIGKPAGQRATPCYNARNSARAGAAEENSL